VISWSALVTLPLELPSTQSQKQTELGGTLKYLAIRYTENGKAAARAGKKCGAEF
jgi:hypothetical protein